MLGRIGGASTVARGPSFTLWLNVQCEHRVQPGNIRFFVRPFPLISFLFKEHINPLLGEISPTKKDKILQYNWNFIFLGEISPVVISAKCQPYTLITGLDPLRASHNMRQESSPTLQNSCELQDHCSKVEIKTMLYVISINAYEVLKLSTFLDKTAHLPQYHHGPQRYLVVQQKGSLRFV